MIPNTNTSSNKPTLLAVGLFVPGTGFTRVFESLFAQLSASLQIHWLGIGYKGKVEQRTHYVLHPCNMNGGDIYGAYGAVSLATEVQAQSVLLLTDLYLLKNYQQAWLTLKEAGTRLLAYVPLDGEITEPAIVGDALFLDELVMYAAWAAGQVKAAGERYWSQNKETSVPHISYIFHGIDVHAFSPLHNPDEQKALKKEIFLKQDAENSIFILNANRYNERKDIESTIIAFAKSLPRCHKPVYLCLHTPNLPARIKEQLYSIIEKSGCSERIILNPLGEEYISESDLVKLYRACSIGINTSVGEGWGLISFEHAACGAAQIVPGHTTPAEIWSGAALITNKGTPVKLPTNPFQMYSVDSDILAGQITDLVNDAGHLEQVSAKCRRLATEKKFNWEYIAEQWKPLLGI